MLERMNQRVTSFLDGTQKQPARFGREMNDMEHHVRVRLKRAAGEAVVAEVKVAGARRVELAAITSEINVGHVTDALTNGDPVMRDRVLGMMNIGSSTVMNIQVALADSYSTESSIETLRTT